MHYGVGTIREGPYGVDLSGFLQVSLVHSDAENTLIRDVLRWLTCSFSLDSEVWCRPTWALELVCHAQSVGVEQTDAHCCIEGLCGRLLVTWIQVRATRASWLWFLRHLKEGVVGARPDVRIIHDRHPWMMNQQG